jgi:two-component system sensor histidine kinase BaeS
MRILAVAIGAVVLGIAVFEIGMQPTGSDRLELLGILLGMVAVSAAAAWVLPRWARRATTLRGTLVALIATALFIVTAGAAVAAQRMFLSSHDAQLLIVVLGLGLIAGLSFAVSVARPWTDDLRSVGETASRIADGDLTARTGVQRADEVGITAAAVDAMARRLAALDEERRRDEEARRAFFASVSHDLRSPLAALQAAVEALRDGVATDPDRYLASIEGDARVLNQLVDDLFLLARIDSGGFDYERVPVDLAEIADEAIEVLAPVSLQAGVKVRLDADGSSVITTGPVPVGRVIRNLLDNAIKHAPSGSEVTVTIATPATVRVADEGPGFPPAFTEAAFEEFARADASRSRSTGGAGLGLAVARGLVEELGGRIWAEPGPGGVVTFTLSPSVPSTE